MYAYAVDLIVWCGLVVCLESGFVFAVPPFESFMYNICADDIVEGGGGRLFNKFFEFSGWPFGGGVVLSFLPDFESLSYICK